MAGASALTAVARGGVVDAIARTWASPRRAMAERMAAGLSEARSLADLMLACTLLFVASLPNALRQSALLADQTGEPVAAAVAAHAFGWIAVLPLLAYGLAAVVHLVARLFGARGGFLPARTALFAAMLAGTPVALGLALVGVLAESVPALLPVAGLLGYAGVAAWLWLFSASLAEAEGFQATGRVAAVMVTAALGLAGVAAIVTRGAVA